MSIFLFLCSKEIKLSYGFQYQESILTEIENYFSWGFGVICHRNDANFSVFVLLRERFGT